MGHLLVHYDERGAMRYRRCLAVLTAAGILVTTAAASASANGGVDVNVGAGALRRSTIAVIGDIPYGATKLAQFPANIAQINADPDVSLVAHLGDIKNGSSLC